MSATLHVMIYKDEVGEWRWQLTAPNGRRVGAATEGYLSRSHAAGNFTRVTGWTVHTSRAKQGRLEFVVGTGARS